MNYIYDIQTNYFEKYYDFYEWEKTDKLIHIKKIPIIKTSKTDYKKLLTTKFKIDNELYKKIKNKTILSNNTYESYLLVTNGHDIFSVQFNNEGYSTKISSLLIEEELDIINIIKNIKTQNINYKIIKQNKTNFKTRKESTLEKNILLKLKKISTKKNINMIKYIYYECFNDIENNSKKALVKIIKNINNKDIINKLYIFFELNKTC